jgi:hypothetical protein
VPYFLCACSKILGSEVLMPDTWSLDVRDLIAGLLKVIQCTAWLRGDLMQSMAH